MEIVIDDTFKLAQQYVENTGTSVFLTGKAGTGKTTFLKYITEHTTKRYVVLAPTGVAAINAGGQTIHSFFLLPLCPYLPDVKELVTEYQMPEGRRHMRKDRIKIIRTLDLLIIDEISMVRADLLDAVDMTLRRIRRSNAPFGGLQLLMIGDARQLSPVVKDTEREYLKRVYNSPYFFCSKALNQLEYVSIELTTIHRQQDQEFIEILNAIRDNRPTRELLKKLNQRVGAKLDGDPIHLMTHNKQADDFNNARLDELPGEDSVFCADIQGEYSESSYPTDEEIRLKKGARVMFIRNDPNGDFYNGKLGTVSEIFPEGLVKVDCDDGSPVTVGQVIWKNMQYAMNEESGEIEQTVIGEFSQIPLRPAWAITIHKSQGLTFERVSIDAGRAFAFGQVYVALSRCRSLGGLSLDSAVIDSTLYVDETVNRFDASMPPESRVRDELQKRKEHFEYERMRSVFDFEQICKGLWRLDKIWKESLAKIYPEQGTGLTDSLVRIRDLDEVAGKFRAQLSYLERSSAERALVEERLRKASEWFQNPFEDCLAFCKGLYDLEIDNKEVANDVKETLENLLCYLEIATGSFKMILTEGFSVRTLGAIRTACINTDKKVVKGRRLRKVVRGGDVGGAVGGGAAEGAAGDGAGRATAGGWAGGSVNEDLRAELTAWRSARFKEENVPAYHILYQTTLLEIATVIPTTEEGLLSIKGIGEAKLKKYGEEILAICRRYA